MRKRFNNLLILLKPKRRFNRVWARHYWITFNRTDLSAFNHSREKADLERAGQLLNDKFQEFRRKAPNIEHNKLVIMVALELTQEVLTMNKSLQEYSHCERLLSDILEDIEKAV